MRIPPRLDALLAVAPDVESVADIGSGHGILARALAARGARVIATERGIPAFLELTASLSRAAGIVEAREGDGLAPLAPGEVELAVVAGMGGRSVTGILDRATWLPRWLLLQPVQDSGLVEQWVMASGWPARQVPLNQEGRWYQAWLVDVPAAARRAAA